MLPFEVWLWRWSCQNRYARLRYVTYIYLYPTQVVRAFLFFSLWNKLVCTCWVSVLRHNLQTLNQKLFALLYSLFQNWPSSISQREDIPFFINRGIHLTPYLKTSNWNILVERTEREKQKEDELFPEFSSSYHCTATFVNHVVENKELSLQQQIEKSLSNSNRSIYLQTLGEWPHDECESLIPDDQYVLLKLPSDQSI